MTDEASTPETPEADTSSSEGTAPATDAGTTYSVEVRKASATVYETGTENRTDESYQLGATIEGTFVPFLTVDAGTVAHYQESAQTDNEQEAPAA